MTVYVGPDLLYANITAGVPPPCGERKIGLTARDGCRAWTEMNETDRAGQALFFTLRACAFALFGGALRALFWALNFALLRLRFCAPALLDFLRSFFAHLVFCSFFALLDFLHWYICDH